MVREYLREIGGYWDITEGVRDIMGKRERDWAMV
jgi:hypothetical protein